VTAKIIEFPASRLAAGAAVGDRVAMHWLPVSLLSAVVWTLAAAAAVASGVPLVLAAPLVPFAVSATLAVVLLAAYRRS